MIECSRAEPTTKDNDDDDGRGGGKQGTRVDLENKRPYEGNDEKDRKNEMMIKSASIGLCEFDSILNQKRPMLQMTGEKKL